MVDFVAAVDLGGIGEGLRVGTGCDGGETVEDFGATGPAGGGGGFEVVDFAAAVDFGAGIKPGGGAKGFVGAGIKPTTVGRVKGLEVVNLDDVGAELSEAEATGAVLFGFTATTGDTASFTRGPEAVVVL